MVNLVSLDLLVGLLAVTMPLKHNKQVATGLYYTIGQEFTERKNETACQEQLRAFENVELCVSVPSSGLLFRDLTQLQTVNAFMTLHY